MDTNRLIALLPEMAIFVKVVESGTFSTAAKKLGVAPSSISRTITRLESALEEKLLERTTRKMRLTPTGQEVYVLCRDMLESAKMAVSAAQSEQTEISGTLRIAAPKALSRQVLMPMVLDFVHNNPKVSFQFKVTDHLIDPVGDEIDVLIRITENPTEGLISKHLGRCELILCATPSYIKEFGTPFHPEELVEHNCLCLGENPRDSSWDFKNNNQNISVRVSGSFNVNHSEIRREAVLKGIGLSIFPEFAISSYIETQSVIHVLPDWHISGNYQGNIIAQYAQSKYIPAQLKAFISHLEKNFKKDNVKNTWEPKK